MKALQTKEHTNGLYMNYPGDLKRAVMLKYRCRILFTTRNRYENHISLEVSKLVPDTLLELVGKFFPEAEASG